jgi:ubiquinone/menaquinone biosynthesis C-methylase UbiE
MELTTAISLIQNNYILHQQPVKWADLGCGSGLFTRALAHYLKKESTIYAVDTTVNIKDTITGNSVVIKTISADFENDVLSFPLLDGVLMANSFHYVLNKPRFIEKINKQLQPNAMFLMIEYDTDTPVKKWVPYPLSFKTLTILFKEAGYNTIERLRNLPSAFGGNMYAAIIKR